MGQKLDSTGSNDVPYQESGVQYVSTYSLTAKSGQWNLEIMPHNMGKFDYIITMGPLGDLTIRPTSTSPTASIPASTSATPKVTFQNLSPTDSASGIRDNNQTNSSQNQAG